MDTRFVQLLQLLIEGVIALGIVRASVELSIFSFSEHQVPATKWALAISYSLIATGFTTTHVFKMMFSVSLISGDDLKKAPSIIAHLVRGDNDIIKSFDV
jgi:hypothetical protein